MTSEVYFIQDGEYIKIGFSSTGAIDRLLVLQGANPRPLTLVATMPGTKALETELHARFHSLRVRGEWFRAEAPLLDFIRSLS